MSDVRNIINQICRKTGKQSSADFQHLEKRKKIRLNRINSDEKMLIFSSHKTEEESTELGKYHIFVYGGN